MKFSDACISLICSFEGFSSTPYPDPGTNAEPCTIGYGTTYYCNGTKVTMKDKSITTAQAKEHLLCHLNKVVLPCITNAVTKPLSQHCIDSLGSFIYNIGCGNFKSSTLLRKLNIDPSDITIAQEFTRWNKSAGKVLPGLVKRRAAESALYFS